MPPRARALLVSTAVQSEGTPTSLEREDRMEREVSGALTHETPEIAHTKDREGCGSVGCWLIGMLIMAAFFVGVLVLAKLTGYLD